MAVQITCQKYLLVIPHVIYMKVNIISATATFFFHFYIVIYFTVRVDIIYKNNIKKMRLVLCAGPLVAANVGPPLLLIHGLKEVIGSLKP